MASIDKNFVVKHGLEVNDRLIYANADDQTVGIGTTIAHHNLHVIGGIGATNAVVTGVSTANILNISGNIQVSGVTGTEGQYLRATETGLEWSSFPKIRTTASFRALEGQVLFNFAYTVGLIDVYVNGVRLASDEYLANNGVEVVILNPCNYDDSVEIIGYSISTLVSNVGSGGINGITVLEEGNVVGNPQGVTSINFVGAAITAVGTGAGVTVYAGAFTGNGGGSTPTTGASVSVGEDAPLNPNGGDLWYNTRIGRAFMYYVDDDSEQWIDFSPSGGGGSSGVSIAVTSIPPSSPMQGDMWYDTELGRGYIWYHDDDSEQWIDFAPGAGGDSAGTIVYDTNWESTIVGVSTVRNVGIGTSATTEDTLIVEGDFRLKGQFNIEGSVTERVSNNFSTELPSTSGELDIDTSLGTVVVGILTESISHWKFNNVSEENGKATTVTLIAKSDSTFTYGDQCSVNGNSVSTGVRWAAGVIPTSSNNDDIFNFTIIKDNEGIIRVYASSSPNHI
jgi:hypothetical protein